MEQETKTSLWTVNFTFLSVFVSYLYILFACVPKHRGLRVCICVCTCTNEIGYVHGCVDTLPISLPGIFSSDYNFLCIESVSPFPLCFVQEIRWQCSWVSWLNIYLYLCSISIFLTIIWPKRNGNNKLCQVVHQCSLCQRVAGSGWWWSWLLVFIEVIMNPFCLFASWLCSAHRP